MKTLIIAVILILLASAGGCGQKKTESTSAGKDTLSLQKPVTFSFTQKQFVKTYNNCKPDNPACTYIKLNYIEAEAGSIKDKINKIITGELVTAYQMPDKNLDNVNLMAETFMKDYDKFKKQFPQMPEVWTIDFTAKVYGETDKVLCLSFENSNYLGGAHPNTYTTFKNIDKQSGDTIGLTNLFGSAFEDKLNKLIDRNYRIMKKLKPGDNLAQNGDLFENKITLTHNFAVLNDKGIEFYYNAYDIAPYVMGPISVKLTAADIRELQTASSPLK